MTEPRCERCSGQFCSNQCTCACHAVPGSVQIGELRAQVSSLTAENERLRTDLANLEAGKGELYDDLLEADTALQAYRGRAEAAEVEVERLRKDADAMAAGAKRLAEALNRSQLVTSRQFGKTPLYDAWMALAAAVDTYETAREGTDDTA